ncbi:MAG: XTP/dITP diphosphatase [Candidatus Bathyarchaeota archaeon]|nr:MAG: XTP/dITP diphosphatase [Candidatus Bathyarchaeota archaeon]
MLKGRVAFFATGNVHKFNEARHVLADFGIAVALLRVKALEIQSDSLKAISEVSALDASKRCRLPVFVEDAGLFIKALNGFPGPYSAYIFRTIGVRGILKLMKGVKTRDAYFKSVISFCDPEGPLECFHGQVDGLISCERRGNQGFGFDPIFKPSGGPTETFAEMSIARKGEFSHRAQALRKFAEWFKSVR